MTYKGAPLMSECQTWATPQAFVDYVEDQWGFKFTLDAAADESNSKAPVWIDEEADSLKQKWRGNVWLNPPFGKGGGNIKRFIQKAIEQRYNCSVIMILIPARTDTKTFHELIIPNANAVYLIKGRFNFIHPSRTKGANAAHPSMLVEFRPTLPVWPAIIRTLEPSKEVRGFV
jgi:phage N-6-adenine-methyltransferase